jgi:hypothetical protein
VQSSAKELKACLCSGRDARHRRDRRERRGKIAAAVPTGQRTPEVEGLLVPGHHEGDLALAFHRVELRRRHHSSSG